ncbi:homeobox protein prospero isoform X5 [Drosophila pseudoobscura]|uniref:Homeobox protein prospero n=1 Tax=Drosophila pseudoobscura pseudoobscura TaxID=46245 RepID=A0A6I8VNP6_DROPS|nr:homeobox protein prospero isoform X5 [Drosophila pseudoobscura]
MMSSEEYDADCFGLYSDESTVLLKAVVEAQPPHSSSNGHTTPIQAQLQAQINGDGGSTANSGESKHGEQQKEQQQKEKEPNDCDSDDSDDVVVVLEGCEGSSSNSNSNSSSGKASAAKANSNSRSSRNHRSPRTSRQIIHSSAVGKTTTCAAKKILVPATATATATATSKSSNSSATVVPLPIPVPVSGSSASVNKVNRRSRHRSLSKDNQNLNQSQNQQQTTSSICNSNNHNSNSNGNNGCNNGGTTATAAGFMSSAAAAAAGAAGGALFQPQPQASTANTSPTLSLNPSSHQTAAVGGGQQSPVASSNSPGSGSVSGSGSGSASSLLTAAFGNLFGGSSAKMLNELFGRQMKQAQDATSGLPQSLDNAMLAAAMETATSAELLSAAGLVGSHLNATSNATSKLLLHNNNSLPGSNSTPLSNGLNASISPGSAHSSSHSHHATSSPKGGSSRRVSACSDRSLDGAASAAASAADVAGGSPPRAASVSSLNGGASSGDQQLQHDLVAHHMLRNILQGKKELMQLDQELRTAMQQQQMQQQEKEQQQQQLHSKLNNNTNASNNNNHNNNNNSVAATNNNNNMESINLIEDTEMADIKIKSEPQTVPQPQQSPHGSSHSSRSGSGSGSHSSSHSLASDGSLRRKSSDSMDSSGAREEADGDGDDETAVRASSAVDEQQQQQQLATKKESVEDMLDEAELLGMHSTRGSDLESLASPSHSDMMLLDNSKDDVLDDDEDDDCVEQKRDQGCLKKPGMELKRARVENIVSGMRCSPSSIVQAGQLQVNGCKKRKLYQPQQHAMERYVAAAAGLNFGLNLQSMMLDQDDSEQSNELESPQIQQKRVEKNALKSQLRSMQEQLAEMQQKYVQLCTRMEQESECQELDNDQDPDPEQDLDPEQEQEQEPEQDNGSSDNIELSPSPTLTGGDISPAHKEEAGGQERPGSSSPKPKTALSETGAPNSTNMLSQMMSKMMSSKLHNPLVGHPALPQGFPPLLQHMGDMSHAAAMYQQFFFEQEARMAKEAAEQQQQQQQQQQHQQQQQEQQRRFEQEQQEQRRKEVQEQQQQIQRQQQHLQQLQQQQMEQQQQQQQHVATAPRPPQMHHPAPARLPTRLGGAAAAHSALKSELSEKFQMLRNSNNSSMMRMSGTDLEGLADVLKSEITTSLSALVDTIVTRFVHQRRLFSKQADSVTAAAEQLNKDLLLASQILDRKSPRTKVADRGGPGAQNGPTPTTQSAAAMFQAPKTPQGMNPVAAAALYNSMTGPFCLPPDQQQQQQQQAAQQAQQQQQSVQQQQQQSAQQTQQQLEQNEALSLVVTPKKKRHKVTDTRITPRTVSRILAQDGVVPPNPNGQQNATPLQQQQQQQQQQSNGGGNSNATPAQSPTGRSQSVGGGGGGGGAGAYHPQPPPPPPPMMPVSLPTSVAIPNPSLHESKVFSPYSPFFNPHAGGQPTAAQMHQHHHQHQHQMQLSSSPPGSLGALMDSRDSPPLPHPPSMLHPALLAAAHHGGSPDYKTCLRAVMDAQDRQSECNSADMSFDGMQPTSSTLTPMHLRKAKLMFFWVRYPSSAVLKMYFPDIKFNKNNTAQLVKWFSNFREFYYIQMEKYARQAVTEGIKTPDDLLIAGDSELYRVLNLHYNRNNHIEVPQNFRFVVEQTLREFFRAIQGGKDTEQSWKKSIYKIISRMDDPVPEYFKSPNFLEQLE